MEEMREILAANNLKLPINRVGESPIEIRAVRQDVLPRGDSKGKRARSHYHEVESQSDIRTVTSGKLKDPSS